MPSRAGGTAKLASTLATRRSAASASATPAPKQPPSIAATTGIGSAASASLSLSAARSQPAEPPLPPNGWRRAT